jgi:hypothetical protein
VALKPYALTAQHFMVNGQLTRLRCSLPNRRPNSIACVALRHLGCAAPRAIAYQGSRPAQQNRGTATFSALQYTQAHNVVAKGES